MAPWGLVAGGYGVVLALTAIWSQGCRFALDSLEPVDEPQRGRPDPAVACAAYALVALGAATVDVFWVHLLVPGALLLVGYWLSGFFFGTPQPWLERWLIALGPLGIRQAPAGSSARRGAAMGARIAGSQLHG